jgi:hypothetical protein
LYEATENELHKPVMTIVLGALYVERAAFVASGVFNAHHEAANAALATAAKVMGNFSDVAAVAAP